MQVAGAEVLVAETIRRLKDQIEPTIFCLDGVGQIGERMIAEGIPLVNLGRKPGLDWKVAWRMAREIRKRKIRVVHAHQYSPFFYAALAKIPARFSFRLILTEHGRHYPDVVSWKRRWFNRLFLDRLANAVNACCEFSAYALMEKEGFRANRIEVIENGIDLTRYCEAADLDSLREKFGFSKTRKYIACVARFHPVKDHAMLIRAVARLTGTDSNIDLVLVGDGPLRPQLEAQVRDLKIEKRVKFLGIRNDVADILRAVDIFALTSVSEAASLTLLEAMACSRPVVVTDVGGNPEIVREGIDGFRVPRNDDAACAAAFLKIVQDPALAKRMGESGRKRVEEIYTLERTLQRYKKLYEQLA
ncbi:glycosyltransferase [Telmatocola sphagniphila]|uniref:Glycosyltransferase n=2 Tax=Telmatocola sphagniphila TaxID=1123043 RepID=A0A8E6EVH9_9BACT|nr:glycosyltransferase [Telmatocola sphagniphila]